MTKQATDNGASSIISDEAATDNRHLANAKASAFAKEVVNFEGKAATSLKQLGHFVFRAVYVDGNNLDTIIGENKLAAGWASLSTSDEGKKAKQRLEASFSGFRKVAEAWTSLSDEQREAILNGTSSVVYMASEMRKVEAKAKAEAAKAEAASEAAASTTAIDAPTVSLSDKVNELIAAYQAATADERDNAFDAISTLFDIVNSDSAVVDPALADEAIAA